MQQGLHPLPTWPGSRGGRSLIPHLKRCATGVHSCGVCTFNVQCSWRPVRLQPTDRTTDTHICIQGHVQTQRLCPEDATRGCGDCAGCRSPVSWAVFLPNLFAGIVDPTALRSVGHKGHEEHSDSHCRSVSCFRLQRSCQISRGRTPSQQPSTLHRRAACILAPLSHGAHHLPWPCKTHTR